MRKNCVHTTKGHKINNKTVLRIQIYNIQEKLGV